MSREGWMKKKAGRDGDNGWSERGGYMAAKVSKLDEQFNLDAPREIQKGWASSCLFRGVAIYVNGYTDPSADELRRLMMVHGGQFHVYYSRSKTTHIIANNLPNSKIQELRQEKVVSPKWITDSIKAGRLLPHLQYQLYAKQRAGLFSAVTSDVAQRGSDSAHSHQSHAHVRPRDPPLSHEPAEPPPPFSHSQGRTDTARPQSHVSCRPNGSLHACTDATRHAETDETRVCSAADPFHQVGSAALTTGNAGPVNGALKESGHGPHDPYEFPHSPPGPLAPPPGSPEASEPPPCTANSNEEQIPAPVAAASHCLPPLRVNGGHLKAFSLDGGGGGAKPQPPTDKRLLAQTGGLISEYYAHSRLHQISTWRTGFSEYVNELHSKRTASGGATFPGRERLRRAVTQRPLQGGGASVTSCVMHVDMDCFFVSVGIRHRPELRGKPVAVTSSHGTGRVPLRPGADPQLEQQLYLRKQGAAPPTSDPLTHTGSWQSPGPEQDSCLSMAEIASCSYEARRAGVRNGMFFGKAKQLCPTLQSVPYDFQAYKEVALSMYEVLASYTHDIEALSCDEVLVDASALLADLAIGPEDLARAIRADIREKTGCCASIGMGSNILLARLSTRRAKPDGQFLLKSEDVDDFIRYLPVSSLPGVGPVMGRKLAALGVRSCGDLQQVSLSQLQKKFGPRTGQTLFRFCRGLDERPVRYEKERKSVSAEMNYNIRFTKVDEAECFLSNLSMEVQRRLQDAGLQGRRVTLKVMVRKEGAPQEPSKYGGHGICDNLARTVLLAQSTDSGQLIAAAVIKLFHAMKLQVEDLRGLGIQVQLLEGSQPKSRSIKDLLLSSKEAVDSSTSVVSSGPAPPTQLVPGTSGKQEASCQPPSPAHSRLNVSIEIPPPSQVDRSVLQALPPSLRQQVEQSWTSREPPSPAPPPAAPPPAGPLVLQIPNHPNSPGLVLELPGLSQVDPDVFAALPKELQEELRSAYGGSTNAAPHSRAAEPRNPLLQLKQAVSAGRVKRRYKRKNMASPMKKNPSPQKKAPPPLRSEVKTETAVASLENQDLLAPQRSKFKLRPPPALAGACDLPDIKTLLREWVTTITDPMEEDILQVVKFCTDLIEHRDLEKLDLIIKYMKRLMQHSVESVWSMAFDFILDNVQVVVQQMYGSTLKVT